MQTWLPPSELQHAQRDLHTTHTGGRVIAQSGETIVLADALGSVEITLVTSEPSAATGSLVGQMISVEITSASTPMYGILLETHGGTGFDTQVDVRRLLFQGIGKNLKKRAQIISDIRTYFEAKNYCETQTPIRVPSPGLDAHLKAFSAGSLYLITSPEYQMKRLLVGGLPRVFQLVACFRDEESGRWHNSEFTMLEWYRAFADYESLMFETEELVRSVILRYRGAVFSVCDHDIDITVPFERLTVCDAFMRHAGWSGDEVLKAASNDEDRYFSTLVNEVEPAIAACGHAVFLCDYPASQASLARKKPSDPRWAERFELYVGGVELCNGFGELCDPVEQRNRFLNDQLVRSQMNLDHYPIDERFLDALIAGMPPAAGNALGVDRLVALALGANEISEILAFPTTIL